jgi:polyisoprenoid-binding protein YceI
MTRFQKVLFTLVGFVLSIASSVAAPQATGDTYRITTPLVTVMCPLTVGGSFEARTSALAGDVAFDAESGVVSGAILVDLATLQTGIGLRDRHMKEKYLEIGRSDTFTAARLEEIHIERSEGGSTTFHGKLTLHGEQHPVSGMVDMQSQQHDSGMRVRARFSISLAAFDIQPPRYLGIGVRDEVQVQVQFTAVATRGR